MDGAGHQFLADAALTQNQDRGLGLGHLLDQAVHLQHGLGVADDVGRLEALLQLAAQATVLVFQGGLLHVFQQVQLHRLGRGGGQDGQHFHVQLEQAPVVVDAFGADGAHDLLAAQDGHADEGQAGVGNIVAAAGTVEEVGLVADARHHHGLAAFHHLAGNALAQVVDAAGGFLFGQAEAFMDEDFPRVGVVEADHAAHHLHVPLHQLQQDVEGLRQIARLGDDAAHFVEQGQQVGTTFPQIAFAHVRYQAAAAGLA